MRHQTISIAGMSCGHCVAAVRHALEPLEGVQVNDVRIGSADLAIDASAPANIDDLIVAAVTDAGYHATPSDASTGH